MPWFEYEGLTPGGTAIAGRIEAADHEQAGLDLRRMHIELRDLRAASEPPRRAPISESDFVFFNEQLASLADAGIALDEGLTQLARDVGSNRLRGWIEEIVADLRRGKSIDEAIAVRERGLPLFYARVIRAGIASGNLAATLFNLSQHLRLMSNTRRLILEMSSYPLIVLVLAFSVVSFCFLILMPQLEAALTAFDAPLPPITRLMIRLSHWFPLILAGLAAAFAAVIIAWQVMRLSEGGLRIREWMLLKVPGIGRVHLCSILARFLRSAAAAVGAGSPLPDALRLSAEATGSAVLTDEAERVAGEIEKGESILSSTQSCRVLPPLIGLVAQTAMGRDALPLALAQLAQTYENRVIHAQGMIRAVLFPLLVILVGALLFGGFLSMYLPFKSIFDAALYW